MAETYFIIPEAKHNALTEAVYRRRGYLPDEAADGARLCAEASRHGIRTHNAIKALHLDHLFGSGSKGCVPGAQIQEVPSRFEAARCWNANRKLGQSTAYRAMDTAIALADKYGIGFGLRGQRLPLSVGRRIRARRRPAGLHRVHQLHGRARGGGSLRRKIPDARHEPPFLGLPDDPGDRVPDRDRLGDLRDRHGSRPAAEAGGPPPSSRWRPWTGTGSPRPTPTRPPPSSPLAPTRATGFR